MLDVIVITPTGVLFEGRAQSVLFPGEQGVFEPLSPRRNQNNLQNKLLRPEKSNTVNRC